MKVLLATDGSSQATVAVETAVALLKKERTKFDLLCVAPEFVPPKAKREKDAKKRSRMIELYRKQRLDPSRSRRSLLGSRSQVS